MVDEVNYALQRLPTFSRFNLSVNHTLLKFGTLVYFERASDRKRNWKTKGHIDNEVSGQMFR